MYIIELKLFYYNTHSVCLYVLLCSGGQRRTHGKWVRLCFHHVGQEQTRTDRFGGKHLYQMSNLTSLRTEYFLKTSFKFILFYVCMYIYHVCVCGFCAWCQGGWKRALDLLDLKLQMVVRHHVGSRSQT